ncbi:MAG: Gfo/Idh/MocA family oxidoreductase [Symbiobacteriaceae bacterium]|nr:Gfo/Idh/MocA family oxidoreductase [Symbiobacteriaceae bacterium]
MKPVTLALLGAGQRGQGAYGPFAVSNPFKACFVAVVEPDDLRRETFCLTHNITKEHAFRHEEDFFKAKVSCDAVLICTQDKQHYSMAMQAMQAGYHVLLEKPMSPDAAECIALGEYAAKTGRILVICHVLRYTKFFMKIKEILDSGAIGDLMTISHNENVGYFHQAHSFVRGNWRSTKDSSPMILAKSCHDMDMLLWLAGGRCTRVSSFGGLSHFTSAQAPKGAAKRCIDGCAVETECPYSALKIYLYSGERGWPTDVLTPNPTDDTILEALRSGPYGRCVYHCDNDVVDHQTVNLEFDNGVTAVFNMSAFTHAVSRTLKLMGSHGEIRADMENNEIEVYSFANGDVVTYNLAPATAGHGGGDLGIMQDFVALVAQGTENTGKSNHEESVHSHLMALAAEESRLSGETIDLKAFHKKHRNLSY